MFGIGRILGGLMTIGLSLVLLGGTEARAQGEGAQEGAAQGGGDASAWAGIEEFVVTGYSSSLVGDLAAADSVIAWSEEDLVSLGAADISDLAAFTPSLEIVTSGATTPTFFVRGIGLNDFNPNSTGAVAVYQDDVAINGPAIQLGLLFDTEAVNVLRGPQGTGQARNASAGAIKVYSRKPTGEFGGYLRSDFGNFDAQDYEGALEAPIFKDILSVRGAFRVSLRDGWMQNRCAEAPPLAERTQNATAARTAVGPSSICGETVAPGQFSTIPEGLAGNLNDTDVWAARGTLRFEPTPELSWLLNFHGSRRDELSQLGQSIGTKGIVCEPGTFCQNPRRGAPDSIFDEDPRQGILGGTQGALASANLNSGYVPTEIRARLNELAPCLQAEALLDQCRFQDFDTRIAANEARLQVADELARDLDEDPFAGDFNRTGDTTNDTYGGYLKGDFELPGELNLVVTTGVDRYRRQIDIDLDFSPETLFETRTQDDAWQVYQDLTLSGTLGAMTAMPLSWEVGGWMLREELDAKVNIDLSGNAAAVAAGVRERIYGQETWSFGGFAYGTIDILDDFTLDGGFRYNWERKDFDMKISGGLQQDVPFKIRETWDQPTGTIRLTYRFREDINVFWKYTHGWKPGTINATATQFTGPTVAEPEKIDSFEFGLHGSWFDGSLNVDGSFFTYDYSNYQVFTAQQFFGGNTEFVVLNADSAEVYGIEVDGNARPWTGGFLQVRFSWLETQFNDFTRTDQFLRQGGGMGDPFVTREQQNAGNPLLNSPRFKVSLTAQQEFSLGRYGALVLRYDGVWTDKSFFDQTAGVGIGNDEGTTFLPDNTIGQEAFWLHNLRTTWRSVDDRVELSGWIRNIENKAYKTFAFDASNFQSTTVFFVGDPRTYGASIVVKFF